MGFFKKLFDKKECSICGGEIGLLGNRKLEDGNCCKTCAGKLSPWFDDRRHSTVAQIREQLAYREENRKALAGFRPTGNYGEDCELKVELLNGVPNRFVVARTDNYLEENADLIAFRDVTSFNIDIEERERELMRLNDEGEEVSYSPPRYEHSYDFHVEIFTTNPYCDDIRFCLNRNSVDLETVKGKSHPGLKQLPLNKRAFDPMLYPEYRRYKTLCEELETLFRIGMQGTAQPPLQTPAPAPAGPKFCSNCGAPAEGGKFCQNCGSRLV